MKHLIAIILILLLLTLIAQAQCTDAELKAKGLSVKPWPRTHIWSINNGCEVTPAYKDSLEGIVVRDYYGAIDMLSDYSKRGNDSTYTHLMLELLLWRASVTKPRIVPHKFSNGDVFYMKVHDVLIMPRQKQ